MAQQVGGVLVHPEGAGTLELVGAVPTRQEVVLSLLWSAGLVLVFAPLAVARYRRS